MKSDFLQVTKPGVVVHARRMREGGHHVTGRSPLKGLLRGHRHRRRNGGALPAGLALMAKLTRQHGRPEALKDVISAWIVVPVFNASALELQAELEAFADHPRDARVVEAKVELVGEAIARPVQVDRVDIGRCSPVVGRESDDDLLVEVQVDDADRAPDGLQVRHVGALQANFFVAKVREEAGASKK